MYIEYHGYNQKDGALKKVNMYREELVGEIIGYIFTLKGKRLTQISFDDINNKFDGELYVRFDVYV
jgi:hypothetical protein